MRYNELTKKNSCSINFLVYFIKLGRELSKADTSFHLDHYPLILREGVKKTLLFKVRKPPDFTDIKKK